MKDISSIEKSKDVVTGVCINRESVYYVSLFSAAFVASVVLFIIALVQNNTGLIVYSSILMPIFLLGALAMARISYVSKNTIYSLDGVLVIKSFFVTKKITISDIEKLTCVKFENEGKTTVKVSYSGKSFKRLFKNITKEEIAHLRRITNKH